MIFLALNRICNILRLIEAMETFRNWTSSYRDQKSTIKRCKWKGVDVSQAVKDCFPPIFSFNKIKEICPQKDLRVWPTLTKGELLGDLQDEPNGPRDVLHFQCNGCRGDLQVSLSLLVNACQCLSKLVKACQCSSMLINACQCLSILINACQCLPMLVNAVDQSCKCC